MTNAAARIIETTRPHTEHIMNQRLMTEADLYRVTKLKQNAARVRWFLMNFGVRPVQSADGSLTLTWGAYEIMQARRAGGVTPTHDAQAAARPKLVRVGRAA